MGGKQVRDLRMFKHLKQFLKICIGIELERHLLKGQTEEGR